jgi:hypothetical protein
MKVAIRKYSPDEGAWFWITRGIELAFQNLGWDVDRFEDPHKTQADLLLCYLGDNAYDCTHFPKKIMFITPNYFPGIWNNHENYVSNIAKDKNAVEKINSDKSILKWTFCDFDNVDYWNDWDNLLTSPLAYDNFSYPAKEIDEYKYDVFYCGSWANNGYNSKKKRIIEFLGEFKDSGLKCGFFVNKNLPHEKEIELMRSSRVCVNIHDDYAVELGLDTNERTFKALGANGLLVSDRVQQIARLDLPVQMVDTPKEMVQAVQELVSMNLDSHANREMILEKHTYTNRVEEWLNLI